MKAKPWTVTLRRNGKPLVTVTLPPLDAFSVFHVNVLWYGAQAVSLEPTEAKG